MPVKMKPEERVRTFIESLTFSKGQWAGQPFKLLPWQWERIIQPAFGALRPDGSRQYRFVYVEIPKKNGKTELGAAVALYMLCADGEGKPEVFSCAGDREQAGLVYSAAAEMVLHSPILSKRLKVLDSRKRIINPKNSGFYQVLSSESELQHGLSPSAIVFDELHAQPSDRLWTVMTSGTHYARKQQLCLVLTTAGVYDKNSLWWKIRAQAQQIERGIIERPDFLPVLYLSDPEKDDPADRDLWRRVNPSLGQIFSMEKIEEDYAAVVDDPVAFQNFLRFRLNIPIRQLSKWMPMDKWDRCDARPDPDALRGRPCWGGLDLASKTDLAAFVLVFPPADENGTWEILPKFYCPEEGILKRSRTDKVPYDIWRRQGFLTATDGNVIDYEFIERDVFQAAKDYDLREIGFDSWNAQSTATRIMDKLNPTNSENGFQMVEFRQGPRSFNEPAKDLLVHVLGEKVRHGGHPVLRWNADNLVMRQDPNGNIAPDKEKATEKIDGMVALIMGWGRAMQKKGGLTSWFEGKTEEEIRASMCF